jgi:hypothetical protein
MTPSTISIDQVESVYVGKGRCCRCGCGGEYYRLEDEAGVIESNEKKIRHYLKKLASGKYAVTEQDGLGDEYIYEINLSRSGNTDRVATFYVRKKFYSTFYKTN